MSGETVTKLDEAPKPKRIQLRRTRGWRKPAGAIVVSRPSLWGNPFTVAQYGRELAVDLFADVARGIWNPSICPVWWNDNQFALAHETGAAWTKRLGGHPTEIARYELAGHDLCCWCGPGQPCHADVLLEIANGGVL